MSHREEIIERLESISDLPPFPDVVVKLNELSADSNTDISEIEEAIKIDPIIAISLLHIANTPAFNSSSRIASISEAIVRIGSQQVSDIALSLSLIRDFPKAQLINDEDFWNHSLSCAYAAQVVNQYARNRSKWVNGDLYKMGLVHDLGILILDHYFKEFYEPVIREAKLGEVPLVQIENDLLGINHAEVGAHILESWQMPEEIVEAVRYQYAPHKAMQAAAQGAKILHIANYACENQGLSNGAECFDISFSNTAWFELGMRVDDIEEIIDDVKSLTEKAKAIFHVAKTPGALKGSAPSR